MDHEYHTSHITKNKQNFLTSIIVKINIYDHKKIKEDGPDAQENFYRVNTCMDQKMIMMNQFQILYTGHSEL